MSRQAFENCRYWLGRFVKISETGQCGLVVAWYSDDYTLAVEVLGVGVVRGIACARVTRADPSIQQGMT